jgi:putative ABC transport system substrate-binding protein
VHLGLIASEARRGGNVTGISPYVTGLPAKQLELAREVVPGAGSIGVLTNLTDAKAPPQFQELKAAGLKLGVKLLAAEAGIPDDLDGAIQTLASQRVDVMIVLQTSMLLSERLKISALVARARIPTVYGYREHVDGGGLISYGVDLRACFNRGAYFVDKIMHGIAPGELPVEFPTKLELVVNLKTAKALGLTISTALVARADDLIE